MRTDTFDYYIRDLSRNLKTNVEPLGAILEQRGKVNITKIRSSTGIIFKTGGLCKIQTDEFKNNPMLMFQDSGE